MFLNSTKNTVHTFFEWVFYIFIALFPFVMYSGYLYYGTATRSVNLILIIEMCMVVLGFALLNSKNKLSIVKSPITIGLFCFLLIVTFAGIFGVDMGSSFWSKATRMTGLFYMIHLGLFYLFFIMIFHEQKKLQKFIQIFLISAAVFSIGALLSKDGFSVIFTDKSWTGFTFGNSTFAAMYLYAAFMMSVYYVATQKTWKWWKYLIPFVFLINPYIINRDIWLGKVNLLQNPLGIIGEAQATSFVVLISIIALCIIRAIAIIKKDTTRNNVLLATIGLGIIVTGGAMYSFMSPQGTLREMYLDRATTARPIVWELSAKAIADRPVLGWGVDNFDRAFEAHYDNRLLEAKNGSEAWFDRAHNVFIDQTVEAGYVGVIAYMAVYIIIIGGMLYVVVKSRDRDGKMLAVIMIIYFVGHLVELQTAFDTSISYVPLAIMAGIATILLYNTQKQLGKELLWQIPERCNQVMGGIILIIAGTMFFVGTVPIVRAETANGAIRKVGSSDARLVHYGKLFGSPMDKPSFIWRTSADFQRGISLKPEVLEDAKKREGFKKELSVFVGEYEKYINENPEGYRIKLSLASTYIYERLFDINHLAEAHAILDEAIVLVPQAPQAYWMKSVAYLYQREFDLAREWAQKAYDLNSEIEQSQNVIRYIDESIKTFPEINFFSFVQI